MASLRKTKRKPKPGEEVETQSQQSTIAYADVASFKAVSRTPACFVVHSLCVLSLLGPSSGYFGSHRVRRLCGGHLPARGVARVLPGCWGRRVDPAALRPGRLTCFCFRAPWSRRSPHWPRRSCCRRGDRVTPRPRTARGPVSVGASRAGHANDAHPKPGLWGSARRSERGLACTLGCAVEHNPGGQRVRH